MLDNFTKDPEGAALFQHCCLQARSWPPFLLTAIRLFQFDGLRSAGAEMGSGERSAVARKIRRFTNCAGFPEWISKAGMDLVTMLPAAATPHCPIITPGHINAREPTHDPSSNTIGSTLSPKCGSDQSWLPVHRYAPCERQQFVPILTLTRLSIQTSSPIQLCSPMESSHGYFTRTPGLRTTPRPSFAPKQRRIN